MSSAATPSATPGRAETLTGFRSADVKEVGCRTPERSGRGDATPRADIPDPTRLAVATVVHAAAALYLGLGSRDLRHALAMGFSLAELSATRGQSVGGLSRAIASALRRTGGPEAPPAAAVDQMIDVAAGGWNTWQAMVERLVAAREPGGWRADAA